MSVGSSGVSAREEVEVLSISASPDLYQRLASMSSFALVLEYLSKVEIDGALCKYACRLFDIHGVYGTMILR